MLMLNSHRKLLEYMVIVLLVFLFCTLKLYNNGYFQPSATTKENVDVNNSILAPVVTQQSNAFAIPLTTAKTLQREIKIAWRYHSDDDGFVFPRDQNEMDKRLFLSYEPINSSLTRQLVQFENAVVFAYFLDRTLLVPPIALADSENKSHKTHIRISEIIDFDLLSNVVELKEFDYQQHLANGEKDRLSTTSADGHYEKLGIKTIHKVCQDPRLGFWLDYIPSVDNIDSWRTLKQQLFSPMKLRFNYNNRTEYWCPGT